MRSHTRSPAASWDPYFTTVTRCYSTVPTETLTRCSACRIIWPVSFATRVAEHQLNHCRSLSVRQRIDYKLANLCYLAISFHQPVYLAHLIRAHTASRVCYDHQRKVFFPLPRTASTLLVVVYLSRHQYSGLSTTELSDRQTFLRTDFKTFLFSL